MANPQCGEYVTNRRAKVVKSVHYSQPSNSDSDDQNILNETFEEVDGLRMNQPMQERHRRISSRIERDAAEKERKDRAQKLNRIGNTSNDDAKSKSIVQQLLEAQRRTKIAVTNCFDHQTVLDIIGSGCVEKETMQDMAVAIDTASMVYGFRVDKTHIDAQDTRITFIKGKQGSTKAKAYDLENEDNEQSSSREEFVNEGNSKRKEDKERAKIRRNEGVADDNWQNRYQGLMEESDMRSLSPEQEKSDDEPLEDKSSDDESTLAVDDDLDEKLRKAAEKRKRRGLKGKGRGKMLIEDEDVLEMASEEYIENDYYQRAVAKHKEGTAISMLMHNARTSGDGRVLYLHSRVVRCDQNPYFDDVVNMEMVKGVRDLLDNALSSNPSKLENDLIPLDENRCTTGRFLKSGNLDGHTHIDYGNDTNEDDEDDLQSPDRTIMESTSISQPCIVDRPKKKACRLRGQDLSKLWIPDHIDIPHVSTADVSDLERILQKKIDEGSEIKWGEDILAEELEVQPEDIWTDTKHAEAAGFDDDLRDIDSSWNSIVVKKIVSSEEAEAMLRRAEQDGSSSDDVLARKRRVLQPGEYIFFAEKDDLPRIIIADPWSEEGAVNGIINSSDRDDDLFMDANTSFDFESPARIDDDCMGNDVILDEIINNAVTDIDTERMIVEEQHMMDVLIGDVEKNISVPTVSLESATDDIADVPVASELIAIDPDAALKGIGKIDDFHWRAKQPVMEKKERDRKEKRIKTEERGDEHYFLNSSNVDRVESRARFKCVDPRTLERSEDFLFAQNRKMERRSYAAYDFENFIKPGLLYKGRYGGVRFERSRTSHPDISHFNKLISSSEMFISGNDDELMVRDGICNDWLNTFGGFKIYTEDESHISFHSAQASFDSGQNNFNYNDDGFIGNDHDNDSFHSAQQDSIDEIRNINMRLKRAALAAEFQCLAGDDSDENDGETAQILDRKYIIKHLRVDTTKMKAAMKTVLSNPLMASDKLREVSRSIMDSDLSVHLDTVSSSSSEKENAQQEETSNTVNLDKNEIDILEVSRAVLAPPDEESQTLVGTTTIASTLTASVEMARFAAEVRQEDFVVEGTHTFTSLFTCLPHRMNRRHVREVTVANSLVIALHMCNENSLQLLQERPHSQLSGRSEPWMMDFTFSNGRAPTPPDTATHNI